MITKLANLKPGIAEWHILGLVKSRNELKPYRTDNTSKCFDFKLSDDECTTKVVCFKDISLKFDKVVQVNNHYSIRDSTAQETRSKGNTSIEIIFIKNSQLEQQTVDD